MHGAAYRWIADRLKDIPKPSRVLEIGSRDVNGSPRALLPGVRYVGIDVMPGNGVDVVGDGATFTPAVPFSLVLCCETLEHSDAPQAIVENAVGCTVRGGHVLMTCATEPRAPHSAVDGGALRAGEWYGNVKATDLTRWLTDAGADVVECAVSRQRGDLYVLAKVPA
jgi:hypothetical protein